MPRALSIIMQNCMPSMSIFDRLICKRYCKRYNKELDEERAREFMIEKHMGQYRDTLDTNGEKVPYSTHPDAVAEILREKGFGKELRIAAYFHDLKEETKTTRREIIDLSNQKVYRLVLLVTKKPKPANYDIDPKVKRNYLKYLTKHYRNINRNPDAKILKLADRLHNLRDSYGRPCDIINKTIKETEHYFIDMAKGTSFEEDLKYELNELKEYCNKMQAG